MENFATDNTSQISATSTISLEAYNHMLYTPVDEYPGLGLFAAMCTGQAVLEDRVADSYELEDIEVFSDKLLKRDEELRSDPNSTQAQKAYFTEAIHDRETVKSVVNNQSTDKVDLTISIPNLWIKGSYKLRVGGKNYEIPAIKTEYIQRCEEKIEMIVQAQWDRFFGICEFNDIPYDRDETISKLTKKVREAVHKQSRNPLRTKLNTSFGIKLLVDELVDKGEESIKNIVETRGMIKDQLTNGCFIRIKDCSSTPEQRQESMVSDDAIGVSLTPIYCLNYRQMHALKNYIFSNDPRSRTQAKIDILASLSGDVRMDVLRRPGVVLLRCFREACMTRTEIIQFMFQPESMRDVAINCMCCGKHVTVGQRMVQHQSCSMTEWLVNKCHFEYVDNSIKAPSYAFIRPGLTRYIERILKLKHRQQTTAIRVCGDESLSAFVKSKDGKPQRLFSFGFPSVHIRGAETCSVTSHRGYDKW